MVPSLCRRAQNRPRANSLLDPIQKKGLVNEPVSKFLAEMFKFGTCNNLLSY